MRENPTSSFPFPQETVQGFIQRVYQWMAAGLALTGFVAYWAASNPALLKALSGGLFLVLAVAEIALVFWLTASLNRISPGAAVAGFLVYSALNGLTLSFLFVIYTGASIATTFLITAGSFAGVSVFGYVTKSDLTSLAGPLMLGLIGVLIGSFVNFFLAAPVFYWILTYVALAVFIGLTAYATQRLKLMHQSGVTSDQAAILGALMLYLDFINMFVLLLRLFGRRK